MRRLFLLCFVIGLSGCTGHGPKVRHGTIDVHYVDGATKEEADRLGAYLLKDWGAAGGERSVQIKRAGDGYQFRMVVRKEFRKDDAFLQGLAFDAARISRDVFDGAAVEMHACDEYFATLKVIAPRPDVRYGIVDGKAEVFYATAADKDDARRLAQYLAPLLAGAPAGVTYKLARRGDVIEVHMVAVPEAMGAPDFVASLRSDAKDLANRVFPGRTVEIHVCDQKLNVLQVVTP